MPRGDPRRPRAFRLTAAIAAVLLVALVLRTIDVLLVVFIAVLLGLYLRAVATWLAARFRLPDDLALTLAIVFTLGALAGVGFIIVPPTIEQLRDLIGNLPSYGEALNRNINAAIARLPFRARVQQVDLPGLLASSVADVMGLVRGTVLPYLKASIEGIVEAASVLVMGIYLARYPDTYAGGLVALIPPRRRPLAWNVMADLAVTLRAWIVGQVVAMVLLGFLTMVGLWLLNIPYALAFGVFTGVASIVPFFGSLLSTLLPALFALTVGGLSKALAVAGLGIGVHLVEANFVGPVVMERQVNLPPVLTIAGVLVMGKLLGPVGLLVAVPILAVAMVLVRHLLLGEVYGDPIGPTRREGPTPLAEPGVAPPAGAEPPAPIPAAAEPAVER
jgi:predicted PurR-regulated permease PerM